MLSKSICQIGGPLETTNLHGAVALPGCPPFGGGYASCGSFHSVKATKVPLPHCEAKWGEERRTSRSMAGDQTSR